MKEFTNRALAAVFALSLICGSGSIALADRGGNGHGQSSTHTHGQSSTHTHGQSSTHTHGQSSTHTHGQSSTHTRGNSGTAHSCVNPAGNMRGWCKSHAGGDFVTGRVTAINGNTATVLLSNGQTVTVNASGLTVGQQVTLRGDYQNNQFVDNGVLNNFGGPYSSASVRGLIISVSGNSIQIVQGLSLITVNDSNAASRGAINGTLLPGRTITANGNWNGSTFMANSIQ